jgi:hypothetical protein
MSETVAVTVAKAGGEPTKALPNMAVEVVAQEDTPAQAVRVAATQGHIQEERMGFRQIPMVPVVAVAVDQHLMPETLRSAVAVVGSVFRDKDQMDQLGEDLCHLIILVLVARSVAGAVQVAAPVLLEVINSASRTERK